MVNGDNMVYRVEVEYYLKQVRECAESIAYDWYEDDDEDVFFWNRFDTLLQISNHPFEIQRNLKRIREMKRMAYEEEEYEDLHHLQDRFKIFAHYYRLQEDSRLRNKPVKKELDKINFIIQQLERFDSFKRNQNVFDNYISLLKIIQRYQINFNEKVNIKIAFNSKNFNEEIAKYQLKDFFINDKFKNMIFKYDLTEMVQ